MKPKPLLCLLFLSTQWVGLWERCSGGQWQVLPNLTREASQAAGRHLVQWNTLVLTVIE